MNNHENKTKYVKARLSDTEFNAVQQTVTNYLTTISDLIRKALFDQRTDLCSSIRTELIKQEMYNLIQHTAMPKESRKKLIEEMNNHD